MADNNFYKPGGVDTPSGDKPSTDITDPELSAERLQYYGNASIIPTDSHYFSFTTDSETMTASVCIKQEFKQDSTLTKIVIPYEIEGVPVASIGNSAFLNCSSLTSINIPNSVTYIEGFAFEGCSRLTSINIPNSVTYIENSVFFDCGSLTSINIPNSVTYIGNYAFEGCSRLTIICAEGSYADGYAKENGIAVEYTNEGL